MRLFGYSVEWYERGIRPNYDARPFVHVLRRPLSQRWFAVWVGGRIRIGRTLR